MSNATMTATIMVVEDEAAVRELLVLALEANAFDAVAAGNTGDALSHLQSRHVDLLLLDLRLGTESGIDLLKVIRQMPEYEKLPVILLTGCADRNTVLETAHLGVQGYVLKHQFSRKDLIARIHQQLKNREPEFSAAAVENRRAEVTEPRDANATPSPGTPHVELLQSVKPIVTRAQTLEQIDRCAELKALSPTASRLLNMTSEPDCSIDQIAQVIKADQAIALKVLKIANSVMYGYGNSVDTVQQAVSRIGVSQIRQLVLSMAVIDNFHTSGLGEHFSSELFWEHSITTGLIAASIARSRDGDKHAVDFAFTMGLLHDVARMVFVELLDDIYKRVLDTAARMQLPLEQVESRMLLVNHADLTDRLLNAWNFPKRLTDTIAMHHLSIEKIVELAPSKVADVSTLVLADRLAHALLLGSSGNNCQYPTEALVQTLGLKPEAIKLIEAQIPEQTAALKYAMLQSENGPPCAVYRQRLLAKFHSPIRALYVSTNPTIDGYRILMEQLGDPNDDRRPNVAFLYLTDLRDSEALFKNLRERENAAGLKPLPLIVISPLSKLRLEPKITAGREYKIMPSPFSLARLADTVNSLPLSEE